MLQPGDIVEINSNKISQISSLANRPVRARVEQNFGNGKVRITYNLFKDMVDVDEADCTFLFGARKIEIGLESYSSLVSL